LEDSRKARPDGLVDWHTAWVLQWDPVPDAASYVVRFASSEGRGGRERVLTSTRLRIDVAAGTSRARRVDTDRATQLAFTQSQLLVSVAGAGPTGAVGPASAWYRVGDAPPDGILAPNSAPDQR
jgi:hypothetical protein